MYQTSRSGWSEWSQWIWNTDYQQYYRQRVDVSGNSDIQWQSEYEAVQNNQTPRTPVEQMTQQFGAVNIRSPEQTVGDEQNRKAPVQEDIPEDDEKDYDDRHTQRKVSIPQEEMYYDEATQQYLAYPQTAQGVSTPTPAQPYAEASGEYEDPVLQDALAQSKQYTRDRYGSGESSSATYTAYTQDDEDQPTPAVSAGNQEHIIGTSGESETLDPRYTVAPSHMFQPGEVFKVLWPEPAGGGSIVEETVYRDQYGGRIFVHFRRFIVVANDLGHCTCIPISTYGKKGCKKSGVKAEQHGIVAESSNRNPVPLSNEPRLGFPPVRVHISEPGERISKESRVNYSKLTTVEHNVKVLFIGRVVGSDWDVVTEAVNTSWANKMHTHKKKHRR
ncbi:hypothetical protein ACHAPM_004708 [Fusarium culmorum]|uniref:DUF6590 domain-containing protein n=1 Tax=Fusarium culmorum TaxID=5516 RepID=A0A2T4HBB2_FUSCU|nr:hypothetical protein FCULG_00004610 [Fusarium culmorum]